MKKLLIILFAIAAIMPVKAQLAEAWISMPDTVCPFLNQQQRFHLLQYANAGKTDTITNRFDGKTYVESLDNARGVMVVRMTKKSRWAITVTEQEISIRREVEAPNRAATTTYYDHAWNFLRREHEHLKIEQTEDDSIQYF